MEEPNDQYKIAQLIFREFSGAITETEQKILDHWKDERPGNRAVYNKTIGEKNIAGKLNAYERIDMEQAWGSLNRKLGKRNHPKTLRLRSVLKYAAAVLIIVSISSYFLLMRSTPVETEIMVHAVINPGTQKAVLTTSNNERIELGTLQQSRHIQLANTSLTDTNSTLTFTPSGLIQIDAVQEIASNTIETPCGGEYTVVLTDGTKVYLNAKTKLSFPELFAANKREVTLEGEAYFEVSESKTQPFIVKTQNYEVKVYGTAFNVSAYSSDNVSYTTLVYGSVGIQTNEGTKALLNPGEQASFNLAENSLRTKVVDTHIYTAWKEGKFMFNNESLGEIMRKLERWYNVETEYLNDEILSYHFSGSLDRYNHISEILNVMVLTCNVEYTVAGNKIIMDKKK
jgi:transmembrane sensor